MNEKNPEWIVAARLLRPQGRRGELLAEAEIPLDLFTADRTLWLASSPQSLPTSQDERTLESAWAPTGRNAGRIVLKLAGTDSISDAEQLADRFLLLPLAELPPLDADTFRIRDLIGCMLFDGDKIAGTVAEVQFPVAADGKTRLHDAPDLLVIAPATLPQDADPDDLVLIPFAQAWLQEVNIAARRIVMHLPEGLLPSSDASDADDAETSGSPEASEAE